MSRSPKYRRPKLTAVRVRWWNLAMGALIIGAAFAIVAPLRLPNLRQGFLGNLFAGVWTLILGSFAAWVAYKRFATERFVRALAINYDAPFRDLQAVVQELSETLFDSPAVAREFLSPQVRRRCGEAADAILSRMIFFERFFEVEHLGHIHKAYDAARHIQKLDPALSDAAFMVGLTGNAADLYIYAHAQGVPGGDPGLLQRIHSVHQQWFELYLSERHPGFREP